MDGRPEKISIGIQIPEEWGSDDGGLTAEGVRWAAQTITTAAESVAEALLEDLRSDKYNGICVARTWDSGDGLFIQFRIDTDLEG